MTDHHFNVEVAKKYGVPEAIFIHHVKFWTLQNLANRRNIRLGFCWTYNTLDAFVELFPYWNKRQIEHLINKLIDAGAIAKTNLNVKKYDRTCWYALTAQLFSFYPDLCTPIYVDLLIESHEKDKNKVDDTGKSLISLISQICEMDFTKMGNGFHKFVTPIPDNKPDIISDRESALSVDNFKTEEAKNLCNQKNLNFEKEFTKFSNYFQGKEISLGKFINWLERAKPEKGIAKVTNNDSFDDYVKRFMKEQKCSEQQARDYYRQKGYA